MCVRELRVEVIKKAKVSGGYFYGVKVTDRLDKTYEDYPIYPFTPSLKELDGIVEFVKVYQEELVDFYSRSKFHNFLNHYLGFDTLKKEEFQGRWYKKGVVID